MFLKITITKGMQKTTPMNVLTRKINKSLVIYTHAEYSSVVVNDSPNGRRLDAQFFENRYDY